jgi:hypothetical protein
MTRQLRLSEDYLLIEVVSVILSKGTRSISVEIHSSQYSLELFLIVLQMVPSMLLKRTISDTAEKHASAILRDRLNSHYSLILTSTMLLRRRTRIAIEGYTRAISVHSGR